MRKNDRGLVIELILPARVAGDKPRAMRQIVIFDGIVSQRFSTDTQRSKHWELSTYGEGRFDALDIANPDSWLGSYIENHAKEGYEVYGLPFLIEANEKELEELSGVGTPGGKKSMPRAMVLRIDKARTELGAVKNPWTGE